MFELKYVVELSEFKAWSGAKDRLNTIIELGIVEEAENYIKGMIGEEVISETTLNDILWFEMDYFIAEYENE